MKILMGFDKLRWWLRGSPTISYPGYNCGLCGKWIAESFEVIDYSLKVSVVHKGNLGLNTPTWGICPECIKDGEREHEL